MEVLQLLSKDDFVVLQERFAMGRNGEGLNVREFCSVFRDLIVCKAAGKPFLLDAPQEPAAGSGGGDDEPVASNGDSAAVDPFESTASPDRTTLLRNSDEGLTSPRKWSTISPRKSVVAERLQSCVSERFPQQLVEHAGLLLRWTDEEITMLFHEVDYNGDQTVSFDEFTSFAIASAVHQNHSSQLEPPFKAYNTLQEFPFLGQSRRLRGCFFLPPSDRVITCSFTRVLVHDAGTGRCLHALPKIGMYLSAAYVPPHDMYVISNDQNQLLFVDDVVAGVTKELDARHSIPCERAITQVIYAPYRCRVVLGDRDGYARTVDFELLRQSAIRGTVTMDSIVVTRALLFEGGIACMVLIPQHTLIASVSDVSGLITKAEPRSSVVAVAFTDSPMIILWDYEDGIRLRSLSPGLPSQVCGLSYCAVHGLLLCCGYEDYFTTLSISQPQTFPYEVRDVTSPHVNPIQSVHCVAGTHRVLTTDRAGTLKVWDMRSMTCAGTFNLFNLRKTDGCRGVADASYHVSFDDRNDRVVAMGSDTVVLEYERRNMAMFAHDDPLICVHYSRHFNSLISVTATQFRHWSLSSGTCVSARKDLATGGGADDRSLEVTCASLDDGHGRQMFLGFSDGCIAGILVTVGRELWRRPVRRGERIAFVYFISRGTFLVGSCEGHAWIAKEQDNSLALVQLIPAIPQSSGYSISCYAPLSCTALVASATHRRTVYLIDGRRRSVGILWDVSDQPRVPEVTALCVVVDGGSPTTSTTTDAADAGLSVFALADSASRIHLWTHSGAVPNSRQLVMSLRVPKHAAISSLACLRSGRYLACGTDSGAVVVWDLVDLIRRLVLPFTPSWSANDIRKAAEALPRPPRFTFATRGQENIATLTPIPYADSFAVGSADDDPLLCIWDVHGVRKGFLCRGRGTAAEDDLTGSLADFSFDTSRFHPPRSDDPRDCTLAQAASEKTIIPPGIQSIAAAAAPHCLAWRQSIAGSGGSPLSRLASSSPTSLHRPESAEQRTRRKRHRHQRKHQHDRDMITNAQYDAAQPALLLEVISADPVVARHQGVAPTTLLMEKSDHLISSQRDEFPHTLHSPGSTSGGSRGSIGAVKGPRGVLKPHRNRHRTPSSPSWFDAAQQQRGASIVRSGSDAVQWASSSQRDHRIASVAFAVEGEDDTPSPLLRGSPRTTAEEVEEGVVPYHVTQRTDGTSFLSLDTLGQLQRRSSEISVSSVGRGVVLPEARRHSKGYLHLLQPLASPTVAATARRSVPQFHGARLQQFRGIVLPSSVTLPPVPQVTTVERGWQQIVQPGAEVSSRVAEAQLQEQYETELARTRLEREAYQRQVASKSTIHPNPPASLKGHVARMRDMKKVRLNWATVQREFELGTSVVTFSARTWRQREVALSNVPSTVRR